VPLNEIPKYIHPETRSLIESALEQAWQELKSDDPADVTLARRKLAGDDRRPDRYWRDRSGQT
jgi:hypothetical protein